MNTEYFSFMVLFLTIPADVEFRMTLNEFTGVQFQRDETFLRIVQHFTVTVSRNYAHFSFARTELEEWEIGNSILNEE
jgi:hypothetical protein